MKDLFKRLGLKRNSSTTPLKVDDSTVNTMEAPSGSIGSYPKEVLEIHHEFHTAADKLVLEAKQIIAEAASKNVSKVSRLEALGFKQASQVTELKPLQQKAELSKEQLESLAYYQREYPLNKFITEKQVEIICHKYNLVCGDVGRFKGFVPEKNLNDIVKFKLKEKDDTNPKIGEFYTVLDDWSLLNIDNIEKAGFRFFSNNIDYYKKYLKDTDYTFFGDKAVSSKSSIPGWGKTFQYRMDNLNDIDIKKAIERNQKSLQICAPLKDMDVSGLEIENGYTLKNKFKDIPDPVVLQPVKNGYLILTAWGDEASDPLVANQKFN